MAAKKHEHKKSLNIISALIAGISHKSIIRVGSILGTIAYMFDKRHRRIVSRNLAFSNPELPKTCVHQLTKKIFINMGITFLEICQMTCLPKEEILKRVEVKGKNILLDAVNSPRSVIIFSGHIGNWEFGLHFLSYYLNIPLLLISRRINSKIFNKLIYKIRTISGNILIDKKGALPKMARTLKKGGTIGLLIDQATKLSQGVEVSFFNKTTTATPVVSVLAKRFNSIVLPIFCIRKKTGGFTLIVKPPVIIRKTDDLQSDIQANTQAMTEIIEKTVREYPEQWFWFHKRWKRHYPHLYPEDIEKRRRRREKRKHKEVL